MEDIFYVSPAILSPDILDKGGSLQIYCETLLAIAGGQSRLGPAPL